jgi:Glyoxalase/Bleomycin resistance protein/Dioxygenase superfamily
MRDIDLATVRSLRLPRVGQLGFVVNSIEKSLPYYASFYNIDSWFQPNYTEREAQIGGTPANLEADLIVGFSGTTQIELIETRGQEGNPYQRHLAKNGEGLHHVGFYVHNFDSRSRAMSELGLEVLMAGRFKMAGGGVARFAYFNTAQLCGIILELIEIRLFGISVPQNSFMYNVAVMTRNAQKTRVRI